MNKRQRIKELEMELKLVHTQLWCRRQIGPFHAHHGKRMFRYIEIIRELERISIKWKIKKYFRRIKKLWLK